MEAGSKVKVYLGNVAACYGVATGRAKKVNKELQFTNCRNVSRLTLGMLTIFETLLMYHLTSNLQRKLRPITTEKEYM
jgi:hypothetical protein